MMTTRASVIAWSTGAGLLLGVFIDALLVGVWLVVISILPSIASLRAAWPRLTLAVFGLLLAAIPLVAALLGFFEGRLKTS
jgi:hypothetical protein